MFWRNKRFFKRQYFVAISLFNNIELYKLANIDYHHPNYRGLYAIKCGAEGDHTQLGWAFVSEHASATAAWNDYMREKSMTFSTWYEGRLYDWWPEDQPAPPKDKLDDVQLCVVYEANTKYWREAVNDAWNKLRSGYPAHIEWYDGSPDRKWTMLLSELRQKRADHE